MNSCNQCCGSRFIESGPESGSSILSEKIRMQGFDDQNWRDKYRWKKLYFFIKICNLLVSRPPWRTSKLQEKTAALKKATLKKMKFINWVIFALLDPYPIRIWIHNTGYNTQLENTRALALFVSDLKFDEEALWVIHLTKSLNKQP